MRKIGLLLLVACLTGCASKNTVWQDLDRAARPSSAELQQVQLAVIGEILVPEGRFHVAFQRLVITGMPAPRGQAHLLLFDRKRKLVARHGVIRGTPLWCEGSRVYWFGDGMLWDVPVDPRITALFPDDAAGGNVLDFSQGLHRPVITREKRYGSSGGIDDDPLRVEER